jgi:thiol:disulfide interchange protein
MWNSYHCAAIALLVTTLGFAGLAAAKPWWLRGVDSNDQDFLPPDVAFRVGAHVNGDLIKVHWVIAEGYYLYRDKIEVRAESPDLEVGEPILPAGIMKTDQFLGPQMIYRREAEASVHFVRADFGAHPLQIKVRYQGCADAGLCYPPITKVLTPESGEAAAAKRLTMAPSAAEIAAILGGCGAFLAAGLLLRKGRRLPTPAA